MVPGFGRENMKSVRLALVDDIAGDVELGGYRRQAVDLHEETSGHVPGNV